MHFGHRHESSPKEPISSGEKAKNYTKYCNRYKQRFGGDAWLIVRQKVMERVKYVVSHPNTAA